MKYLLEKILVYVPQYLMDFGLLLSGPKKFIYGKYLKSEETLVQSLLFLGVSLVLVVVMTSPFLFPGRDLWAHVGTVAIGFSLGVSLYAIALRLAWWIVGGTATVRSFFVIYAYYFGVSMVLLTLFRLLGEGVFKVFAPELHTRVLEAWLAKKPIPDVWGNTVVLISTWVFIAGFVVVFVWGIVGWGAYRELNALGRTRSSVALLIALVLAVPVIAISFIVMAAMVRP